MNTSGTRERLVAKHHGDVDDPTSHVSRLSAERGGLGPLVQRGCGSANRCLPPRAPRAAPVAKDDSWKRHEAPAPAPERLVALARRTLAG